MKCPSCNYERHYRSESVMEAIPYKSGKNKGKVKEVVRRTVELSINKEDFAEYNLFLTRGSTCPHGDTFFVCPDCGVMFMDIGAMR